MTWENYPKNGTCQHCGSPLIDAPSMTYCENEYCQYVEMKEKMEDTGV